MNGLLPTREGYKLIGINTTADAESKVSSIKVTDDITVYAIWKKEATVYFNYSLKGLPECEECNNFYEGYSGKYSPSTVVGYTFMGWTTDLNNPVDLSKTVVFSDGKTYYAVWKYNVL